MLVDMNVKNLLEGCQFRLLQLIVSCAQRNDYMHGWLMSRDCVCMNTTEQSWMYIFWRYPTFQLSTWSVGYIFNVFYWIRLDISKLLYYKQFQLDGGGGPFPRYIPSSHIPYVILEGPRPISSISHLTIILAYVQNCCTELPQRQYSAKQKWINSCWIGFRSHHTILRDPI